MFLPARLESLRPAAQLGCKSKQELGPTKVGSAGDGTVVLPALAPLARVRQVELHGPQTVVCFVPEKAVLPCGDVERPRARQLAGRRQQPQPDLQRVLRGA